MSCAEGTGIDCDEVLDQVFEYLHGELNEESVTLVKGHLDSCSPCLQEYGLEEAVRKLVARSCSCEHAPDRLRQEVLAKITRIRVSSFGDTVGGQTTVTEVTEMEVTGRDGVSQG